MLSQTLYLLFFWQLCWILTIYIQPCLLNKSTSGFYHEDISNSDCMLGKDNHWVSHQTNGAFFRIPPKGFSGYTGGFYTQFYIQTSVMYKSTSGFYHESINQWEQIATGQFIKTNSVFLKTIQAECVLCILHNLYPFYTIYIQFTQFISNPCYHENKQRFRMGKITTRYFIKTNSVFFKFHQHVVLCTTGRFYTILTEPHIINKTTSGRRVRKYNQQVIHQANGVLFQIIPEVDFTLFRFNPVL